MFLYHMSDSNNKVLKTKERSPWTVLAILSSTLFSCYVCGDHVIACYT